MSPIETYVFIDLETTGLPSVELNKTKITELSLVAVKRCHLLETQKGCTPRVQQNLTLCFNPGRVVDPTSTEVTGLCNFQLEYEPSFNASVVDTINQFLGLLTKPVCLIAQNGQNYDFPILKKHVHDIGMSFPQDLLCADSLYAFHDILESIDSAPSPVCERETDQQMQNTAVDSGECIINSANTLKMLKQEEVTPKKNIHSNSFEAKVPKKIGTIRNKSATSKARRRLFWLNGPKPKVSYKLQDIYERVLKQPPIQGHRAENDCIMMLKCAVALSEKFVHWMENNHITFTEVKAMTVGVKLGD